MNTMTCKQCGLLTDLSRISVVRKNLCKKCDALNAKKWRDANPDKVKAISARSWVNRRLDPKVRERRKNYYKTNGEKRQPDYLEKAKAYRHAHRTERNAKEKVYVAVKNGVLERPDSCQFCENKTNRAQAHHTDYSKPLDVLWLCASCHKFAHSELEHPIKLWIIQSEQRTIATINHIPQPMR